VLRCVACVAGIVLTEMTMHQLLRSFAVVFFSLGGLGLLFLGILDSSFLFMPLGNDLLIIALTASHPHRAPYYVAMATLGSVIGVAITYWLSAKGGQKSLENGGKSGRVAYVERQVKQKGGAAIAVAALMPPPFPFTPFIIVAGALQYPRDKMLWIIAGSRFARFAVESSLAIFYGRRFIAMAQSPKLQGFILGLIVVSLVGSAASIFNWVRKSRREGAG
jgi:membrane protein YqaA with SNARE-associated domain